MPQANSKPESEFFNAKLQSFIKSMKDFPSVIRTEYTYALLYEEDLDKANILKKKFIERGKTYPYQSDIRSEKELIDIATNLKKNK